MNYAETVERTFNTDFREVTGRLSSEISLRLVNGSLGLLGEAGEFSELIKKWVFHGKELDRTKAILELGDVCYYLQVIANTLGVSIEEIQRINSDKLAKRYPNGFTTKDSVNKADEIQLELDLRLKDAP